MRDTFAPPAAERLPAGAIVKTCALALLLPLAGCAGVAQHRLPPSACDLGEATYECQIERYHNVNVD